MPRYACNLNGNCESDERGPYTSIDQCEQGCRASPLPVEVAYQSLLYSPSEAQHLAPSDQLAVIRRIYKPTISEDTARYLLTQLTETQLPFEDLYLFANENGSFSPQIAEEIFGAVREGNWNLLAHNDALLPWIRQRYQERLILSAEIGKEDMLRLFSTPGTINNHLLHQLYNFEQDLIPDHLDGNVGVEYVYELLVDFPLDTLRAGDMFYFYTAQQNNTKPLLYGLRWSGQIFQTVPYYVMNIGNDRGWRCRSSVTGRFVRCERSEQEDAVILDRNGF